MFMLKKKYYFYYFVFSIYKNIKYLFQYQTQKSSMGQAASILLINTWIEFSRKCNIYVDIYKITYIVTDNRSTLTRQRELLWEWGLLRVKIFSP